MKLIKKLDSFSQFLIVITICSIILSVYVTVDYNVFHLSYNFEPLEEVISITENREQQFNFEIDFPAYYYIGIKFHKSIDNDSLMNLTGLNIFDKESNDTSLYFTWLVKNESHEIIAGDSSMKAPVSISSSNTTITRDIGSVEFKETGSYNLTIRPSVTKEELVKTNPTLFFRCQDHKYTDYHFNVAFSIMLSIFLIFITVIVIIWKKLR